MSFVGDLRCVNQIFDYEHRISTIGEYCLEYQIRGNLKPVHDSDLFSHTISGVGEIHGMAWLNPLLPSSLSVIHLAQNSNFELLDVFLSKGTVSNLAYGVALAYAMKNGNIKIAQSVLQNYRSISPLIYRLIRRNAKRQELSRNQLMIWRLIEEAWLKTLEDCYRRGITLSWNDRVCLAIRSSLFTDQDFARLIEEGAQNGWLNHSSTTWLEGTVLIQAAMSNKFIRLIPGMIRLGCDLARQDVYGNTALIWAVANANNEMARILLMYGQGGPYLNLAGGEKNNTALHLAVAKGYRNVSADGEALEFSNLALIQVMVRYGADIDRPNRDGHTPLHLACIRRDLDEMTILLRGGARLDVKNLAGKTPKELLELDYDSACAILYQTVNGPHFHLDRTEFDRSQVEAIPFF